MAPKIAQNIWSLKYERKLIFVQMRWWSRSTVDHHSFS